MSRDCIFETAVLPITRCTGVLSQTGQFISYSECFRLSTRNHAFSVTVPVVDVHRGASRLLGNPGMVNTPRLAKVSQL